MADRMLYAALFVSVLGLFLISFISPSIKPPRSSVCDVTSSSLEKVVVVGGNITRVHEFKGGSMALTLSDSGCDIEVYLSYDVAASLNSTTLLGRRVELSGVVQIYRGRVEVVVEKPTLVLR
ncbi:MAG: hypothetical protein V1744_04190 [Candidatus Altiarchaeota archaeon]